MSRHRHRGLRARLALGTVTALAPFTVIAAVAWACIPATSLNVSPNSGPAGTAVTVTGSGFDTGPVNITGPGGMQATATGPNFSVPMTIADVPPGAIMIQADMPTMSHVAPFEVTAPPVPAPPAPAPVQPPPPDSAVPAVPPAPIVSSDALPMPELLGLTILRPVVARESVAVSRKGFVELFCGRFGQVAASGTCGAAAMGARSLVALGARHFNAAPGQPARVRFRLSAQQLRRLRAVKQLRMRGTVVAHAALGAAAQTTFTFMLKAPRTAAHKRT